MQIEWYRGYQIRLMFWDKSFFVCWRKKEMKLKKENIIQNDRTGRYANYKLVKKKVNDLTRHAELKFI